MSPRQTIQGPLTVQAPSEDDPALIVRDYDGTEHPLPTPGGGSVGVSRWRGPYSITNADAVALAGAGVPFFALAVGDLVVDWFAETIVTFDDSAQPAFSLWADNSEWTTDAGNSGTLLMSGTNAPDDVSGSLVVETGTAPGQAVRSPPPAHTHVAQRVRQAVTLNARLVPGDSFNGDGNVGQIDFYVCVAAGVVP